MDDLDILRDENFEPDIKPDRWYYFEVVDRSSMLMNHVDSAYCNHPGLDEEHARKAQQVMDLLMEIYQYAAQQLNKVSDS